MRFLPLLTLLACWTTVLSAATGPELPTVPQALHDKDLQVIHLPGDYALACDLIHEYNGSHGSLDQVIVSRSVFLDSISPAGNGVPNAIIAWNDPMEAFLDATKDQIGEHDWREFPLFVEEYNVAPEGATPKLKPTGCLILYVPNHINVSATKRSLESLYLARGFASYPSPKVRHETRGVVKMFVDGMGKIAKSSGIALIGWHWGNYAMIGVGLLLFYLGIAKGFEPLLLVPIAMGCIFVNATGADMVLQPGPAGTDGGLLYYFFNWGITTGIFPLLIFLGVGALTDFGPLLANPWSALLGGAAQFGIFGTFLVAAWVGVFTPQEAGAIAIIGGADGPTSIFVASRLAPELLGAIAVAAYSYMALVPIIQPPFMKMLTNDKERQIMMEQRKPISQKAKIAFPLVVILLCLLLLPSAVPLIGMLMFGNLLKECGVTDRLSKAAQNEIINIVTIALGLSVGTKLSADAFLNFKTLLIVVLGCAAFCVGTMAGVIMAKIMNKLSGGKINPLIGSAGVSAVPMAARVSQVVGQQYNRQNMLLMHAMGPNVAGVIGSAVAAGILLALLG